MTTPDPYYARRRRKDRRTRAVAFFLVALFLLGLLGGTAWPLISSWLDARKLARELVRIAALPYPDPHPKQTDLLTFTDGTYATRISTDWIPIAANWTDDGTYTGFILMRLTTFADPSGRKDPARDISITLATTGDIRLPADNPLRYPLMLTTGGTTTFVRADPNFIGSASMEDAPTFRDFMWYDIPTPIIVQAANTLDFTITVAGLECVVPQENFEALRAFTATLKPGYTPPTPSIP